MNFSYSALFDAREVGWFLRIALYVSDIKIAIVCLLYCWAISSTGIVCGVAANDGATILEQMEIPKNQLSCQGTRTPHSRIHPSFTEFNATGIFELRN